MKVYKNKYAHRNLLVFILLSLAYLLVVYAFSHGASFNSHSNLISFLLNNLVVILLFPFVVYSVYKYTSFAKYLLFIFFAIILTTSFVLLSASFNKLILGLNFAYALFAFYFFTSWEIERSEAGYNPMFAANDLEKITRFPIQGIIYSGDRSKFEKIYLTNIDEYSCFVLLDKSSFSNEKSVMEITFDGVVFSSKVMPVSQYDQGMGLRFIDSVESPWSLTELCKICRERGLFLHQ
jgi:hypothetical protein